MRNKTLTALLAVFLTASFVRADGGASRGSGGGSGGGLAISPVLVQTPELTKAKADLDAAKGQITQLQQIVQAVVAQRNAVRNERDNLELQVQLDQQTIKDLNDQIAALKKGPSK